MHHFGASLKAQNIADFTAAVNDKQRVSAGIGVQPTPDSFTLRADNMHTITALELAFQRFELTGSDLP